MLWIDIGLFSLLLLALGFCWHLSQQINGVKELTKGLIPNIQGLNNILEKASKSIATLKFLSESSKTGLEKQLPDALAAREDLRLLIEHADRLNYRLDSLISQATETEKNLKQTVLVSIRQQDKIKIQEPLMNQTVKPSPDRNHTDQREAFVEKIRARYPKEPEAINAPNILSHR